MNQQHHFSARPNPPAIPLAARLIFPAAAIAAILLLFTLAYGMVDDLMIAGIIAMIVPMMALPLFRGEGVR